VVAAAAVAMVAAQVIPDFVWIPRLLSRRAQDALARASLDA